jgi:hypothetical protein
MTPIDFANEYPIERDRVFKTLESCRNLEHLEVAEKYFAALKQKWSCVSDKNMTVKLMVEVDEKRFLSELKEKRIIFV